MAVLVTALFGLIALRVSGIYFLLITFALGQLVYSVLLKGGNLTRGHDGLGGIPYPDIGFSLSRGDFYYFMLIIFIICVFIIYRVIKSPFGHSLQGIRESETRMRILGYNIWLHKYIAFIISGLFAGVSGVLYVFYNGLIVPENVGFAASGVAMIIIIIGGSGTLWGALISSVVIFLLNYYVSILIPARWPIVLGACFVGAAMFTRAGIFPQLNNLWTKASKSWLS
jgi:branched-chain amino acid transport system permease protein